VTRNAGDEGIGLGRSLADLRKAAGLRQVEVAAAAGLSQSKLSDIEHGRAVPTAEQAHNLIELYRPEPDVREELVRMAAAALEARSDTRLVIQRGTTLAMQRRWKRIEDNTRVVRAYQPAVVLGSLQTDRYASVVMRRPVESAEVRSRAARREQLLAGSPTEHVLVQTEGSLRFRVGSAAIMADQMTTLLAALDAPNVRLGVIPEQQPVDMITTNAFHLYDDTAAVIGLHVATATLTEEKDVRAIRELFDQLVAVAVWGDDARAVIEQVRASLM
jgi:transcriptional regulator with XRE-family HTH domain